MAEEATTRLAFPGDDLVTGEAVALELPPATLGLRLASGIIDLVIEVLLLFGISMLLLISVTRDEALFAAVYLVGAVGVLVGLPTAVETLTRGKTLGKLALGLRTVRDDAGPISFRHALTRHLVGVLEIWLLTGVPALICAMVSQRCKRLGDFVAGTHVVRDRFKLNLAAPPVMPPALAGWARVADLAALPTELTLAVRQFLTRANGLDPARRDEVGRSLAHQVSSYVAPPPPMGTHPEYFLAAVLAERRERDTRRLMDQRLLRERLHASVRRRH